MLQWASHVRLTAGARQPVGMLLESSAMSRTQVRETSRVQTGQLVLEWELHVWPTGGSSETCQ